MSRYKKGKDLGNENPKPLRITSCAIHLPGGESLGDGALEGELLLLELLGAGVLDLELGHGVAEGRLDLLLLATLELHRGARVRDHLLDTRDVGLELLPRLEALGEGLVRRLELLGIVDHLLDLARRELTNRVGDGDVGAAASRLLGGRDLEDTVDIDLEDTLEDGVTSLHGRDGSKSELAQRGVVLAVDTLTLVDRELNGGLVVGNRGEGPLLDGGDRLATGDDGGEDVALHGDTERERDDIEQKEVGGLGGLGLAGEDTGLDGGTVGNGLVGVDALLELLAVEEVAEELLDAGNTGGTTDKDDLVDLGLVNGGILEHLLDGGEGAGESLAVQFLETSTGDSGVEVLALEERVDLNGSLGGVGESTLSTLASSPQTTQGTRVARDANSDISKYVAVSIILEMPYSFFVFLWNSFLK